MVRARSSLKARLCRSSSAAKCEVRNGLERARHSMWRLETVAVAVAADRGGHRYRHPRRWSAFLTMVADEGRLLCANSPHCHTRPWEGHLRSADVALHRVVFLLRWAGSVGNHQSIRLRLLVVMVVVGHAISSSGSV